MRSSSADLQKTTSRTMLEDMLSISIKMDSTAANSDAVTSTAPYSKRMSLPGSWKSTGTMRAAFVLTCLQVGCTAYAIFLLFFLSPSVMPDVTGPDGVADWAHSPLILPSAEHQTVRRVSLELQEPKSAVCETEEIPFEQKKSNNTKMIEMKTSLFRSAINQVI